MKHDYSDINFVLDRSGSMNSISLAAIEGFNQFLKSQQAAPGSARFTLIQFNDQYEVWARAVPVAEMFPLNQETFQPRGRTAMLDAIGRTIDETGERLAAMPEADRPGKVIVAILTDGLENASQRFTYREVAGKIAHQREKYGWEFLFLGANQDAIAMAARLNIARADAATFVASAKGALASYRTINRKMAAWRAAQRAGQSKEDLMKAVEEILREEMDKDDPPAA